jgi:hypothetical protein
MHWTGSHQHFASMGDSQAYHMGCGMGLPWGPCMGVCVSGSCWRCERRVLAAGGREPPCTAWQSEVVAGKAATVTGSGVLFSAGSGAGGVRAVFYGTALCCCYVAQL